MNRGLVALISFIVVLLTACSLQFCTREKPGDATGTVIITGVTANDLQQVMVFGIDEEKNRMIFVKDFFSKFESSDSSHRKMQEYIQEVEKYTGQKVTIKYHENAAGDYEIESINRQ